MGTLLTWDLVLFFNINSKWTSPFLDSWLPWMREPYFWAPLYMFLLVLVLYNWGWKGFWWIVFFILTFAMCDQGSSFLKGLVGRLRPANDPNIAPYVRIMVGYYPQSGSFTSSHAANHFGLAMFCFLTLRSYLRRWAWLFFVWAAVISYAQIYVGVHYPTDILGGALLGCLAGTLGGGFFNRRIGLELLPERTT